MIDKDIAIEWLNIEDCYPNTWNPNSPPEFIKEKILQSIAKFGFIDPIKVRQVGKRYEIVDGEHRWQIAKDIQKEIYMLDERVYIDIKGKRFEIEQRMAEGKIPVINFGTISREYAQQLTIVLNETRGKPDANKLSELLKELEESIGYKELEEIMPYQTSTLESLLGSLEEAQQAVEKQEAEEAIETKDKWVKLVFCIPDTAVDIVESEIDRILGILELDTALSKEVKYGLALEKICVLSAQTPTESLE